MKRMPNFQTILNLSQKEEQYHDIRTHTIMCANEDLHFGLSFYGVASILDLDVAKYKRIEVWCESCPSRADFDMLHKFFNRNVPKKANSIFVFIHGKLYEIN